MQKKKLQAMLSSNLEIVYISKDNNEKKYRGESQESKTCMEVVLYL
jgi:hypothetical protein